MLGVFIVNGVIMDRTVFHQKINWSSTPGASERKGEAKHSMFRKFFIEEKEQEYWIWLIIVIIEEEAKWYKYFSSL